MPTTATCRRPQTGSSVFERKKQSLDGHMSTLDALFGWMEYPLLVYSSQHGVPTLPSVPGKPKQPAVNCRSTSITSARQLAQVNVSQSVCYDIGSVPFPPASTFPDQARAEPTHLQEMAVYFDDNTVREKHQNHNSNRKDRIRTSSLQSSSDGSTFRPYEDCILAALDDGLLDCDGRSSCAVDTESVIGSLNPPAMRLPPRGLVSWRCNPGFESDVDASSTTESEETVTALKARLQQLEERNRYLETEVKHMSEDRLQHDQAQQAGRVAAQHQQQLQHSQPAALQQLQLCNPPAAAIHIAAYEETEVAIEEEQAEATAMAVDQAISMQCYQPHDVADATSQAAATNADVSSVDDNDFIVQIGSLADDALLDSIPPAGTTDEAMYMQHKDYQQQQQSQLTVQHELKRLQMLYELLQTDYADLEFVLKETERQRREYAARYAFVVMDTDKAGYINTQQVEGYELFSCYAPEVLRAAFSHWHWHSGFPGYFNIDDFVRFVECAEDRSSRHSQRFWFSVLDCDGDGHIGWQDMKQLYDAVDKTAAQFVVSFEDLMNQIRDMVEQQQRPDQGFTCSELWASKLGAGVIALLTNHNNMLLQRSTAEWGRANFPL